MSTDYQRSGQVHLEPLFYKNSKYTQYYRMNIVYSVQVCDATGAQ
jgi:hypothetical protein